MKLSLSLKTGALFLILASITGICCAINLLRKPKILILRNGPIEFKVRADHGGRIVGFSYNNKEVITQIGRKGLDFFGSTFWTSPQSDWGWPPYKILESEPYEIIKANNDTICLKSKIEPNSKIQFKKYFYTSKTDTSIRIKYVIINKSDVDFKKVAPWEITRVSNKGLVFMPAGDMIDSLKFKSFHESYRYKDGYWGLFLNAPRPKRDNFKLFANGTGKIGFFNDSLLFIKKYPDTSISEFAPQETEIELFINDAYFYMELEEQGAFKQIAPRDSITWEVKWYLRELNNKVINNPDSSLKEFGDAIFKNFN